MARHCAYLTPVLLLLIASMGVAPPLSNRVAAPQVIILHSGVLTERIVLTDWHINHRFVAAIVESGRAPYQELTSRPYFDAALFWGIQWGAFARDSVKLKTLEPNQATQHGRVYLPRSGADAPLFVFKRGAPEARLDRLVRRFSVDGIALLQEYGVPFQMKQR